MNFEINVYVVKAEARLKYNPPLLYEVLLSAIEKKMLSVETHSSISQYYLCKF